MADISSILKKYGFTESECKVYCSLLNREQANGYELSKASGVPRSKIYNILEKLTRKNVVLVNQAEKKFYRAISPDELIDQMTVQFEDDRETLSDQLREIQQHQFRDDQLWKIDDREALINKARFIIKKAQHSLLIQIWADELTPSLINLIKEAEERVEQAIIILFHTNPQEIPFTHAYYHGFETDKLREGRRWLSVVVDNQEVVYGTIDQHSVNGVWTQSPAMIELAGEYVKHDAYTLKIIHDLPAELKKRYGQDLEGIRQIF